ncbi:MAG TPA: helix-turn-helix transcriptional regulator [Hyphomonas sp.]|nr:helix-turn-helix transcriptional regulator [Hyphomonas sp.]MCA8904527.1 helix-turn-helix transcriptional regulator [Hyphomonas sp.]MCB9960607.1 helix-turn-helix transcriptional regulator [Hyphomonas sp.]HPE49307.1 helix-turn-helix transcriptional regulator [Hyphomonas sp.]HPR08271.1 helix-turn-helix transcriptional regulator [Denitromonas sp.]
MIPIHRHAGAYVSLVAAGSYDEASYDGRWHCETGCLILHPGYHAHFDDIGSAGAVVLNCSLTWAEAPREVQVWRVPALARAVALFRDEPERIGDLIGESEPVAPRTLPDWQAHIAAGAVATDTPLAALANEAGVSAEHASRGIRKSLGLTPQALRAESRWRMALAGLGTDAPLADIAADCGFADQSHLSRTVRQVTGLTPRALRWQINSVQERPDAP